MKFLKPIRRDLKKYRTNDEYRSNFQYAELQDEDLPIEPKTVFFQSFDGRSFGGSPFYMLLAMYADSSFSCYKKIIAVRKNQIEKTYRLLHSYGIDDCEIIPMHSPQYCHALLQSKYLIDNSTLPTYFTKRPDQILMNTWHGTPLKAMGRSMEDRPHATGNTQRNFLMSDYLLYPNQYMFEHFREDYMIENFFSGKYILAGYPCNSRLFDTVRRNQLRDELGLSDKRVVVYMPTWRQTTRGGHRNKQKLIQQSIIMNLDEHLDDDIVLYARPHYYVSLGLDFKKFKHVRAFPEELEPYDILNLADILVTDYSSVMFDFLNTGKEIALLTYDEQEYRTNRGSYADVADFPFFRTRDAYEMADYLNSRHPHEFDSSAYDALRQRFCPYDGPQAAIKLCRVLLENKAEEADEIIDGSTFHNKKQNCLIYAGALTKNGITTSLLGLLDNLDTEKRNYLLSFFSYSGAKQIDCINGLPSHIQYYPMQGQATMTRREAIAQYLYYRHDIATPWVKRHVNKMAQRDANRLFPGLSFDYSIHFTGYEKRVINLFLNKMFGKRLIYAHNDMVEEHVLKDNYHVPSMNDAYSVFERIVAVRDSLKPKLAQGFSISEDKIAIVHNVNRLAYIQESGDESPAYSLNTKATLDINTMQELLNNGDITKFVNVARFSPEKGQDRLISAFMRFHANNPNSVLILIGGLGKDYAGIVARAMAFNGDNNVEETEIYASTPSLPFTESVRYIEDSITGHPASQPEDQTAKSRHTSTIEPTLPRKQQTEYPKIVVIQNLENPLPFVAKSDAFVLSSFYEGLPMSIMEALILDTPVIATDIPGPREFLAEGYGHLVENSEDGLYQGLCDFMNGNLRITKEFDAEAFNEQALAEFKDMLEVIGDNCDYDLA